MDCEWTDVCTWWKRKTGLIVERELQKTLPSSPCSSKHSSTLQLPAVKKSRRGETGGILIDSPSQLIYEWQPQPDGRCPAWCDDATMKFVALALLSCDIDPNHHDNRPRFGTRREEILNFAGLDLINCDGNRHVVYYPEDIFSPQRTGHGTTDCIELHWQWERTWTVVKVEGDW